MLHEFTEQRHVTEPLCAFSATARRAADEMEFRDAIRQALVADRPTVILVYEDLEWLQ